MHSVAIPLSNWYYGYLVSKPSFIYFLTSGVSRPSDTIILRTKVILVSGEVKFLSFWFLSSMFIYFCFIYFYLFHLKQSQNCCYCVIVLYGINFYVYLF